MSAITLKELDAIMQAAIKDVHIPKSLLRHERENAKFFATERAVFSAFMKLRAAEKDGTYRPQLLEAARKFATEEAQECVDRWLRRAKNKEGDNITQR